MSAKSLLPVLIVTNTLPQPLTAKDTLRYVWIFTRFCYIPLLPFTNSHMNVQPQYILTNHQQILSITICVSDLFFFISSVSLNLPLPLSFSYYQFSKAVHGRRCIEFFCDRCAFRSKHEYQLEAHIRTTHERDRCRMCGKTFKRPANLVAHERHYHSNT